MAAIRDLVQAKGLDLVERLMTMALADETEDRVRIEAIQVLLDRAMAGRPTHYGRGGDRRTTAEVVSWLLCDEPRDA